MRLIDFAEHVLIGCIPAIATGPTSLLPRS